MTSSVIAEEYLLDRLQSYSDYKGISVGLIVGQFVSSKCYVVALAPSPEQSKESYLENFQDLEEDNIIKHVRYVLHMLPGGLAVAGLFIVSPTDIFTSANLSILKKTLKAIDLVMDKGFCSYGKNSKGNNLVFHYNTTSKNYQCKYFDYKVSNELKSIDWKFKNTMKEWRQIDSTFAMAETFYEKSDEATLFHELEKTIGRAADYISDFIVYFNDKKWDSTTLIENVAKSKNSSSLKADLFWPGIKEDCLVVTVEQSAVQILAAGSLPSRIFVHPKAAVEEAEDFIRQDLLRSLAARLEMHYDSLVDEEDCNMKGNDSERMHEPPRRVLVYPNDWTVSLMDFLFPGENTDQVVSNFRELLDLEVDPKSVVEDFENPADFENVIRKAAENVRDMKGAPSILKPNFIVASIICVLIAIFIAIIIKST